MGGVGGVGEVGVVVWKCMIVVVVGIGLEIDCWVQIPFKSSPIFGLVIGLGDEGTEGEKGAEGGGGEGLDSF